MAAPYFNAGFSRESRVYLYCLGMVHGHGHCRGGTRAAAGIQVIIHETMSEPSKKIMSLRPDDNNRPDVQARLDRLEDSFLAAIQEIRAVKVELAKQADRSPSLENLLDVERVAEILGANERWIYQQARLKDKAQRIPSIKIGKFLKFSPAQLQKWLERKNTP